jgi:hypothetical protein
MNTLLPPESGVPPPTGRGFSVRSRWIAVGLICLILVIIAATFTAGPVYRFFFPYLDQGLSRQVTISSEWKEFVPKEPLRVERQIQMVVLDLDKSIKLENNGWGLLLPDGTVVTPEVELLDEDGKVYPLIAPSAWFSPSTGVKYREFSAIEALPKDKTFRAVRVRCDKPILCNRIFWRCYNMWDVE